MVVFPDTSRIVLKPPVLQPDCIQIWQARLSELPIRFQWLNKDEHNRYEGFAQQPDANAFAAGRTLLRWLLGTHLNMQPEAVPLEIAEHGKPQLTDTESLQFNLSHSGDLLLIALRREIQVGVDLERDREHLPIARIAARVFTPDIAALFQSENPDRQAFLEQWTALEARQKCLGMGIFNSRCETTENLNFKAADGFTGALAWPAGQPPARIEMLSPADNCEIDTYPGASA